MKWDVFDDEDGHKSIRRRDPALRGKSFQEIAAENACLREVVEAAKAIREVHTKADDARRIEAFDQALAALEDQP